MNSVRLVFTAILLVSCSRERGKEIPPEQADLTTPADSLVLTMPDSAELWYTGSMVDTLSGAPCTSRALEIRRGEKSTAVPLLYTSGPLEIVDDTTVRAPLIRDCAAVGRYLVNTRNGQPRREP